MEKLIGLAIIVLILNTNCSKKAKESDVPKAILEAFNSNFKDARVESWDKEKDGGYEAEFDCKGTETSAAFSAEGKLMETEQEIEKNALLLEIRDYISKNYPGKEISEVAKIITGEGAIMYEVEIDKRDIMFDEKGNFIK